MRSISFSLFFIAIVLLAVKFSSCGDGSTTPILTNIADSCGTAVDKSETYSSTTFVIPSTYTLGSERYFNFYFGVDSICTDKHVDALFSAKANDTSGAPINFRSAIEWQIFWEKTDTGSITVGNGLRYWNSNIDDLGLKVPFGESAAKVFVNVYVHFPTRGSITQDTSFLRRNLSFIVITFHYRYHKPAVLTSDGYMMQNDFDGDPFKEKKINLNSSDMQFRETKK